MWWPFKKRFKKWNKARKKRLREQRRAEARVLNWQAYPARPRPRRSANGARGVHLVGDLGSGIGLGEAFRGMASALSMTGLPIAYTEVVVTPQQREPHHFIPTCRPDQCGCALIHLNGDASFYNALNQTQGAILNHRYVIGYWYWELPEFHRSWLDSIRCLDEIWVSSRYVQDHLAAVSPVPVVRIPPPVEPITTGSARRREFQLPEDRFVFAFVFDPTSSVARKNPFAVIEAFRRAFQGVAQPPLLVLKTHYLSRVHHKDRLRTDLLEALSSVGGMLIDEDWTKPRVLEFLSVVDCFVSLHRAEGLGLGIAESMALGKAVIATGYSGNCEFMTPDNSFAVAYRLREITGEDHQYQPGFEEVYALGQIWAEPDIDHAARLMRMLWENPKLARDTGIRAAVWIREHFHTTRTAEWMRRRLDHLDRFE